jgi:hypothetical protein
MKTARCSPPSSGDEAHEPLKVIPGFELGQHQPRPQAQSAAPPQQRPGQGQGSAGFALRRAA